MSIIELGALGEFVGAIAVVFTLGYLAVQIRQSNRSTQSAAVQAFFDSFSTVVIELQHDEQLRQVIRKGFHGWVSLTQDEQAQMHLYWSDYVLKLQMGYRLWRQGSLDGNDYQSFEHYFLSCAQTEGVRAWWSEFGEGADIDFLDYLTQRLGNPAMLPKRVTDVHTWWSSLDPEARTGQ